MLDRRDFLKHSTGGLGSIALAQMLGAGTHHAPRAKRVVQLFMSGAASQVDTFDYKPLLIERAGQKFDPGGKVELFQSDAGHCMPSPWKFRPRGESGKQISDLVPHLAECADDMAFVHSMVAKSNVHGPATFMQTTGFVLPGFPSMGSWVAHGLGSANHDLPTFVVLPDARGYAPGGPSNWGAGFLPATHQGTMLRAEKKNPLADLFPPESAKWISKDADLATRAALEQLNAQHRVGREDDTRLAARIASYEMAARLQLSAPEVFDLRNEPASIKNLYGLDDDATAEMGRRCLVARRMLERGVRFIQIWSGADNGHPRRNWDSHEDLAKDHGDMARSMDRPCAALLLDLKQRGLLDDTIILWTTEFGRMPCSQGSKGRDHNPFAFTN